MQYIALFIGFLLQSTLNPDYVNIKLSIQLVTIIYFAIILSSHKKVTVLIPAILILISDFITNNIVGLNSVLIMFESFLYYFIFIDRAHKQSTSHNKKPLPIGKAILIFSLISIIGAIFKIFLFKILNYNISLTSEIICYFANVLLFMILASCTLKY